MPPFSGYDPAEPPSAAGRKVRHFVFALTSDGRDAYSLMTRAAIISIRHSNPEARVTLASDTLSLEKLEISADPVLAAVEAILPVDAPRQEASFRSRFIKTSIGHLVDGPFLYLDSDTLIRKNLDPLFALTSGCDLAAAPNNCGADLDTQLPNGSRIILSQNGWRPPPRGYYNAGIIWFGGTPASQEFSRSWHQRWLVSSAAGVHFDQPAFNASLADSDLGFTELPVTYNAQFKRKPSAAKDACIWHYFASFRQDPTTRGNRFRAITGIEDFLFRCMEGEDIDPAVIARLAQNQYPWIRRLPVDRIVTRFIETQDDSLTMASFYWLQGRRSKALRKWISSGFHSAGEPAAGNSPE